MALVVPIRYYNGEGKPGNRNGSDMYGEGATRFFKKLEDWREQGTLEGLDLS